MSRDLSPVVAAIRYENAFDINGTLRSLVSKLQERGAKIGGVLQESKIFSNEQNARLYIVDIRSGRSECITQNRGSGSQGCKLDPRGLAEISYCVTDAIDAGVDLIVINKFGRAESEGNGLLSCIADAISADLPVLTTVREPYVKAWNTFHGGLARDLPPRVDAIVQWFEKCCRREISLSAVLSIA